MANQRSPIGIGKRIGKILQVLVLRHIKYLIIIRYFRADEKVISIKSASKQTDSYVNGAKTAYAVINIKVQFQNSYIPHGSGNTSGRCNCDFGGLVF